MMENGRIKVGIDYDGVVIKKAKSWNWFHRGLKIGLPNLDGVLEGISAMQTEADVDVLGVYTVRPEWFRGRQTRNQIRRRGTPIERITHTANSPKNKIEALLLDAAGYDIDKLPQGELSLPPDVGHIVLIDDSISKVVSGAHELAEEKPHLRQLMKKFILAAFNPQHPDQLKDLSVPGVIQVVNMQNWSETQHMLNEVRRLSK